MMTMVMNQRSITATQLKAKLLGVLDDVEEVGESLTITKHGRPVAQLVPIEPVSDLIGTVDILVPEAELLSPIELEWDALK